MTTLTPEEQRLLVERRYILSNIDMSQNIDYWREIAHTPIAFYWGADIKLFQEECKRQNIKYGPSDNKFRLQTYLLRAVTDYCWIMCISSIEDVSDKLIVVAKCWTVGDVLRHYNIAIELSSAVPVTKFTKTSTRNGNELLLTTTIEETLSDTKTSDSAPLKDQFTAEIYFT